MQNAYLNYDGPQNFDTDPDERDCNAFLDYYTESYDEIVNCLHIISPNKRTEHETYNHKKL